METLHIEHFQARYHLPPSMLDQQDKLDHMLGEMLDGSLALALERLGISPREEICIRRIHAPVRLRSNSADSDFIMDWSMSLAENFHEVLSRNDPDNIIRYPSRIHGFIDFADGVARGDFHRAWAWKQLGFSVDQRIDSVSEAAERLVSSLIRESQYIIPLLTAMATGGRLRGLLLHLSPIYWQDLAMAALMTHGCNDGSLVTAVKDDSHGKVPVAASQVAERIIKESCLAAVVIQDQTVFWDRGQLLSSWAIFILLEKEPVLLRGDLREVPVVLYAIEEKINPKTGLTMSVPAEKSGERRDSGALEIGSSNDAEPLSTRNEKYPKAVSSSKREKAPKITLEQDGTPGHPLIETEQGKPPETRQEIPVQAETSQRLLDGPKMRTSLKEARDPLHRDAFHGTRSHGFTEFGGLLFLLPLLENSGIIDEIVTVDMGRRSLPWFLHALALHILPIDRVDPATLAFCGLRPDAPLPWKDEPGPDEAEKRQLGHWRQKLIKGLSDHTNYQKVKSEQIMQTICCRSAAIVADPGWFEVIFSLRDISTKIRRAGLDQDPGFIPWLGVVIKFFYE